MQGEELNKITMMHLCHYIIQSDRFVHQKPESLSHSSSYVESHHVFQIGMPKIAGKDFNLIHDSVMVDYYLTIL